MTLRGPSVVAWLLLLSMAAASDGLARVSARQDGLPANARAPGAWHTINVPVSATAIAEAAGLPDPALPDRLLFDLVRLLHQHARDDSSEPASPGPTRLGSILERLREPPTDDSREPPTNGLSLPLPIPPELWSPLVAARPQSASRTLVEAILADRRAALLYVGLGSLDPATLDAIAQRPGLLASIYQHHAGALAAFGRSLVIESGIVRLPGPERAHGAWERLAGSPVSDVDRFVAAVLGRDRGRLAYFLDAYTHLGEAHRLWISGPTSNPSDPERALTAAYEVFRRVSPEWKVELAPFYRPPTDPANVLRAIQVTEEGTLAPPRGRRFWERVWRGRPSAAPRSEFAFEAEPEAEPAWLLDQVLDGGAKVAQARAAQISFAQRRLAGDTAPSATVWSEVVAALPRFPSLLQTLERSGLARGDIYAKAVRLAAALSARRGQQDGSAALAVFQGLLATIERTAWAQTIDPPRAERLVTALLELDATQPDYERALARWLAATLLPALADATGSDPNAAAEGVVLRALAGARARPDAVAKATVMWEGTTFTVDLDAGRVTQLERHRRRQGPPTLDQALAFHRALEALADSPSREAGHRVSAVLDVLASAVPRADETGALREALERAQRQLARELTGQNAGPGPAGVPEACARARTFVLADVLTSLAYVPALGDPVGQARLGGHVARRHDFSGSARSAGEADPAWRSPRELVSPDRGWHVEGALLGLDTALARLSLRRLDPEVVPARPCLDETLARRLAIEAAVARGSDLSEEDGSVVASALDAGRARVGRLRDRPEELEVVGATLALEAGRLQSLRWALLNGAADLHVRFSPGELVRLGVHSTLPFAFVTVPDWGCPPGSPGCPRQLSDLAVRLVAELKALRLPVSLLPAILSMAAQDLIDQAQPMHVDDEAALWKYTHELALERIEDYVAALEGNGPLVPVPSGAAARR